MAPKNRIVPAGPGHLDADGSGWSADVHLDLDSPEGDGDTIAILHLGLTNAEAGYDNIEAVGIELTLGDIENLRDAMQAILDTHRPSLVEVLTAIVEVRKANHALTHALDLSDEEFDALTSDADYVSTDTFVGVPEQLTDIERRSPLTRPGTDYASND